MAKTKQPKFGKLPKKHHFALNPYPELRFTTCPKCGNKTGQRKLPLMIYVEPTGFIMLNYTNRYCHRHDLLIGHKHEIEHYLTETFTRVAPEIIGNQYLIVGTAEKKAWRENTHQPAPVSEMQQHIHDFKSYEELRMSMAGWFRQGEQPPMMPPPPSDEWAKE